MRELSSRFRARRPSLDDAEGILAVGIARDIEDLGYPDYALGDVHEELAEAGDGWVVSDESGHVVASALLAGGDASVLVHPAACGMGVGTWLRERVEERAAARRVQVVRQHVGGANDGARRLLEAAGYHAEQHYWRMVRQLDGDTAVVEWPEGIGARAYEPGSDDEAAHRLVQDAFTDIPGNVGRGFEEWRAMAVGRSLFSPELSTVAGDFAGVALCERWEDGQGFVAYLATARDWRGRGLGRALLAASLEKMRAAGLRSAALGVNGRNESATRLYTSAGMRIVWRAERWEKRLA